MIATLGGKSTSSYVWAAEMQNKPLFNKCLRHCILQRSHAVVVPEDLVASFLYQQTLFCSLRFSNLTGVWIKPVRPPKKSEGTSPELFLQLNNGHLIMHMCCYGEFKQGCESTVTLSEMTLRDLVSFISQR